MAISSLRGQSILVVEHEPAVARELESEFTQAGAKVFAAGGLRDALYLAEYPALSAAVVNLRLGNDTTAAVCRRLDVLGIPFMFYTRFDAADAAHAWPQAPIVAKPATSAKVAATVADLLS
jgi:DNA-binding response OmpR family regulator